MRLREICGMRLDRPQYRVRLGDRVAHGPPVLVNSVRPHQLVWVRLLLSVGSTHFAIHASLRRKLVLRVARLIMPAPPRIGGISACSQLMMRAALFADATAPVRLHALRSDDSDPSVEVGDLLGDQRQHLKESRDVDTARGPSIRSV